jgi:hypothetical protein
MLHYLGCDFLMENCPESSPNAMKTGTEFDRNLHGSLCRLALPVDMRFIPTKKPPIEIGGF